MKPRNKAIFDIIIAPVVAGVAITICMEYEHSMTTAIWAGVVTMCLASNLPVTQSNTALLNQICRVVDENAKDRSKD